MKILNTGNSLTNLSWSPKEGDGRILCVEDRKDITIIDTAGTKKVIAEGEQPAWCGPNAVVFVKDHEIWKVSDTGSDAKLLFDRKAGFTDTNKGSPVATADGSKVLVVIRDVKREQSSWVPESAYPVRHFYGVGDVASREFKAMNSWSYGGKAAWFPDKERFAHHEFDATGGARLHITNMRGEDEGVYRGYFPRIAPDGKRVAVVKHTFDAVLIVTPGESDPRALELPADVKGGRFNNPALWIDDEHLLVEAKGWIFELSLEKKSSAIRRAQVPIMRRGLPTMAISADAKHIVYEAKVAGKAELRLVELADWRKETLPEPKEEVAEEESPASEEASEGDS